MLLAIACCFASAGAAPVRASEQPIAEDEPRVVRVVNGSPVDSATYASRWGSIVALTTDSAPTEPFCGGTLIAANVVLTAAHCVSTTSGAPANQAFVDALGVMVGRSATNDPGWQRFEALSFLRHPSYDHETSDHDLALVRLTGEVPSSVASPIHVVQAGEDFLWGAGGGGVSGWIAGWGDRCNLCSDYPITLEQASVPLRADSECTANHGSDFHASTMVCAGVRNSVDACQGDSGGPLVVSDGSNGYRQVGVTSWGIGCASQYYGVYTRTAAYRGWIDDTLVAWNGSLPPRPPVAAAPTPPTPAAPAPQAPVSAEVRPPVGVEVVAAAATSLQLGWVAPSGSAPAVAYVVTVQRGAELEASLRTARTTLGVRHLTPNTDYTVSVASVGADDTRSAPVTVRARTARDRRPPGRPARARVTGRTRTAATLTWARARDDVAVTAYRVERRVGRRWRKLVAVPAWRRSFTVRRLQPGASVQVRVRAVDASGNRSQPSPPLWLRASR